MGILNVSPNSFHAPHDSIDAVLKTAEDMVRAGAEILDVCLCNALSACGIEKVCEIDVTNKTEEMVIEEMIRILEKKSNCTSGIIDWLGKLENEGKLDEFFKKDID